ncbi:glycoside hydrolase family 43 protein [Pelagicoccus sp. SDUM812002]|uniref:glycoside hydrolase family 43 protein n=1 Tax=Pelagicoccus sp. SDUM812002 TaxID=3041266 RepID=UPI0028108CDF|nr:glycoside hydrolase family 43 protein [Pelagicoccus sp. SDUM812002]MDQ8188026.1 glycoside hydrolase family 43 protein [Pelagicoccus sp. SDUM812002]
MPQRSNSTLNGLIPKLFHRSAAVAAPLLLASSLLGAEPAGYLFATFKGEQTPLTEQIYFSTSHDGRNWKALNEGKPVLVSEQGEKGVRDPYLLRSHDGSKFYMVATDLSINLNPNWRRAVTEGSHNIVVWESSDLVNWSEPRLIPVAPEDAGCTWAPEAIYDEENGNYLVFWASTTERDDFAKHRIWAARTEDFKTFGEPFVFIEKPTTVIDTTIINDGQNYYRFTKDEKFKSITMETAPRLSGPWSDVPDFSLAPLQGYEGPECYRLDDPSSGEPARWCLILDQYSKNTGYQPYVTSDLSSGQFLPGEGFNFPFHFRHGSVIPLSAEELDRVEKRWDVSEQGNH